jgi:diamine N-acetyltransferase
MSIELRRASESDIPFIMACETRPGYAGFVGAWTDAEHRTTMAHPDWHYLVGSRDGVDRGFVMLSGMTHRNGNLYLKRIAAHDADAGFGKPFLAAVIDWVFTRTHAHRFWLEVVEKNARARHVYRALGFVEEGIEREAFVDSETGQRRNMVLMAILKPEWRK